MFAVPRHWGPESDVISDPLRNDMSFGGRSAPVWARKDILFLSPSEITCHLGGPSAHIWARKDMLFVAPSVITCHLGTLGPHLGPESDVISDPLRNNMPFVAYRDTQLYCGGEEAEEEDGVEEEESKTPEHQKWIPKND